MEKQFIKVSILDAIRCSSIARQHGENQESINKLNSLFIDAVSLEVKISKDSEEAKLFIKYGDNILLQNYITLESLSLAFNRLYFGKNNKELLKRVEKYYRQYSENIMHDDDNTVLKQEIISDKDAFDFISQYSDYNEYELYLMGKNNKTKKLVNPKQDIKGKPIVD